MSATTTAAAPAVPRFGGGGVKCKQCNDNVYASERIDYDGNTWHTSCFKCLSCSRVIGLTAVAMIKGDLYCKNCFKRIFMSEGKYSSFGEKTLPKADAGARQRSATTFTPSSSASPPVVAASATPASATSAATTSSSSVAAVAPAPASKDVEPMSEEHQALVDAITSKSVDKVQAILKGLKSADLLFKTNSKGVTPIEQAFTGIANSRACGEAMVNWLRTHTAELEAKQ